MFLPTNIRLKKKKKHNHSFYIPATQISEEDKWFKSVNSGFIVVFGI